MQFNINAALYAISYALDCVEHDLLGVTTHHGERVAVLSALLAQRCGLDPGQCQTLAACAVLHDCALTEYVREECSGAYTNACRILPHNMGEHCRMGEKNVQALPFGPEARGAVLYHHENADGSGPFGHTAAQTPLSARIIHLTDTLDAALNLSRMDDAKHASLAEMLRLSQGTLFDEQVTQPFYALARELDWNMLDEEHIDQYLRQVVPAQPREDSPDQLIAFSAVFAEITDYKSEFTSRHSQGLAQKMKRMGEYYGADEDEAARLYFAGALHDIGKLAIDPAILEKPARLTREEYAQMQLHVVYSGTILAGIEGMEDVARMAGRHHEKLDGSGYPQGLRADELDFWDRMIACLDIYQALTEQRPYKAGLSHAAAAAILRQMAREGKLDGRIVDDISVCFAGAA